MSSLSINNTLNINREQLNKCSGKTPASTPFNPVNFGVLENDVIDISTKNIDKSKDGKFSLSEGLKNFAKGIISPITAMFSSPKAFIAGVGMIAGSLALLAATGGAAAPFLVAAGVVMGGFQLANAAVKIINSKDGDDVEKALFNVGAGASTIGLSALGAKASLKQAGLASEGSAISAVGKCFAGFKTSFNRSIASFRSGAYKINFVEFFTQKAKTTKIKDLDEYSQILTNEGKAKLAGATKQVKDILPDEFSGSVTSRSKGVSPNYDKLVKNKSGNKIKDINTARDEVGDLIGTRLILDKATSQNMDKIALSIAEAIDEGKITITRIENYKGPNGKPYFSDKNIKLLENTARTKGQKIEVVSGEHGLKDGGYTTAQMDIIHSNGARGEFQIRGKHINKFADVEHIPYDLRSGKSISKGNPLLRTLYRPIKEIAVALKNDKNHLKAYNKYLKELYEYNRDLEVGAATQKPYFPKELNKVLSVEQLNKIHHQASNISKNYSRNKYSEMLAIAPTHSGNVNFFKGD